MFAHKKSKTPLLFFIFAVTAFSLGLKTSCASEFDCAVGDWKQAHESCDQEKKAAAVERSHARSRSEWTVRDAHYGRLIALTLRLAYVHLTYEGCIFQEWREMNPDRAKLIVNLSLEYLDQATNDCRRARAMIRKLRTYAYPESDKE